MSPPVLLADPPTQATPVRLRVLILEDTAYDAELIIDELVRAGFNPAWERVATEHEFVERLADDLDVILADYQLPGFNGMRALELARARSDVPFILVSGAIEDHAAVEAIHNGADDYLLKDRLARLGSAIRLAIERRRLRAEEARAQKALEAAEERYRVLVDTCMDAVVLVDEQGVIEYANPALQKMFGYAPQEAVGHELSMLQPAGLREARDQIFRKDLDFASRSLSPLPLETVGLHRDGHEFPVEIAFSDMLLAGRQRFAFFLRDTTERQAQRERILRLSRIHAVLSGINAAIVHVRDEDELLKAACQIAVEHGEFGIVWIGRYDPASQEVTPVATAGLEASDLLKSAALSIGAGTSQARGIVARAIRERKAIYVNDISSDASAGGERRREAIRRGYHSVITLPLTVDGEVTAVFSMFAREPDAFDEGEVALLTELAANISFALGHMARQRKLEKLSRIREVSGEINAAIVRVREREALLKETCRIVSEHGRFEFVWTAVLDEEREVVRPIAWTGFSDETVLAVTWAHLSNARVSLNEVLRTHRPAVRNDLAGDARDAGLLRLEAVSKGCESTVCLPFLVDDKVVAAIIIYAAGRGFFDEDELALLNELAADISFALQSIARQEQLHYLSYYDPLTGLPNRALFLDRASQQMRSRSGEPRMVALVLFEIERFRAVNEMLGRDGGDALLEEVARRAESAFGGKDFIARVGADIFGVVVRGVRDAAEAAHLVERQVAGIFSQPFSVDAEELRVAARAGIALFPTDGDGADTLFGNAEAALKRAKSAGERYLFYTPEMNAQAAQSILLETKLRTAVEARQFVLHYQPKIGLTSGGLCGLEALIRWHDPAVGLVPPSAFIPVLEETGLIVDVGRWAIAQALRDCEEWSARGCRVPRIAVNVSAIQLQQRDFVDHVLETVRNAGDRCDALDLEITESFIMRDLEGSIRKLSVLQGAGIHIAMDDFGTGHSSLSYIARLPINAVKIDRSFVSGMAGSAHDMAVVTTIVALARALSLRVVAEGIETREQLDLLTGLGCDEGQGYFFSMPLPPAEMEVLLRNQNGGKVKPSAQ